MNYTFLLTIYSRKEKRKKTQPTRPNMSQPQQTEFKATFNYVHIAGERMGWAVVGWEPGHLALPWPEHTFSQERLCDAKVLAKESLGREVPWESTKLTSLVFAVQQQQRGKQQLL